MGTVVMVIAAVATAVVVILVLPYSDCVTLQERRKYVQGEYGRWMWKVDTWYEGYGAYNRNTIGQNNTNSEFLIRTNMIPNSKNNAFSTTNFPFLHISMLKLAEIHIQSITRFHSTQPNDLHLRNSCDELQ